ncbi:MAG: hypothetical protein GY938_16740 [Ketobacter sp.]|nr:hypothetical protein [Ketobacter sp.]
MYKVKFFTPYIEKTYQTLDEMMGSVRALVPSKHASCVMIREGQGYVGEVEKDIYDSLVMEYRERVKLDQPVLVCQECGGEEIVNWQCSTCGESAMIEERWVTCNTTREINTPQGWVTKEMA